MTEAAYDRNSEADETWLETVLAATQFEMDQYVHRNSDSSAAVAELIRLMDSDESKQAVARITSTTASRRVGGGRSARRRGSSQVARRQDHAVAVKIVVAGGFSVGKSTLIGAVSEIEPLTTEAEMTQVGSGVDDLALTPGKVATTIVMDFGRITIADDLVVYLFGAPGQERFWVFWDELAGGALGAVVLADVRRLGDAFAAIDFFENRRIPHVVAINEFGGGPQHGHTELRDALSLDEGTPLVICDVRRRDSAKAVLVTLLEHAMSQSVTQANRPA